jgi:hypothetical protein
VLGLSGTSVAFCGLPADLAAYSSLFGGDPPPEKGHEYPAGNVELLSADRCSAMQIGGICQLRGISGTGGVLTSTLTALSIDTPARFSSAGEERVWHAA